MSDWSLSDTLGVVVVLGAILSAASALDGLAQVVVASVGAVVALLWVGNFVLRGYTSALDHPTRGE